MYRVGSRKIDIDSDFGKMSSTEKLNFCFVIFWKFTTTNIFFKKGLIIMLIKN